MTIEAKESPDSHEEDQGGGETVDAGVPDTEGELRAELAAASEEVDRLRRAAAEFDNLRKRAERERLESRWNTAAGPLREFLGVVDNLDRALEAEASADDLRAGVEMIRRQMGDLLRRFGVEPVEGVNAPFDPNVHQAVAREESAEVDEPTVVQELQTGYMMESRLLRAAMVRVAVPAPPPASRDGNVEDGAGADADAAAGGA
ncbi:MAG: nucleotide exchange factor GrpE [Holophagales bacterium]|nr:nucleotide exchange factor GrpE [Holophagales bacterium]MYG30684.1 nucleotide exchange factor GrpE [Holophagales bacterium]MYI81624.1 nucleotide exchange factor GrpE [Holophagales bacterium]